MSTNRAALLLGAMTAAWAVIAAPALVEQWSRAGEFERSLGDRSLRERVALLDNPASPLSDALARAVPASGCVTVLAYAGPAAIEYYNARLDYLLYPRRVQVFADSAAAQDGCEFLAVFRDTAVNLAAEPFAGSWDSDALESRVAGLERVSSDSLVRLYRAR